MLTVHPAHLAERQLAVRGERRWSCSPPRLMAGRGLSFSSFLLQALPADLVRFLLVDDVGTRRGVDVTKGRASVNASGLMPLPNARHVVGAAIGKPGRARGEYAATAVV